VYVSLCNVQYRIKGYFIEMLSDVAEQCASTDWEFDIKVSFECTAACDGIPLIFTSWLQLNVIRFRLSSLVSLLLV
jgi:hypothetical protein